MTPIADDSASPSATQTRASLLRRVADWRDAGSWREFHRLYHKLIFGYARRSGLSREDAEDVTQDVFKRVAETIRDFESDPARGTFRGWLLTLTRWRIANKLTRRPEDERRQIPRGQSPEGDTGTIERLPDAATPDEVWTAEWQRHLLDAASSRLARQVKARHFQAFELYILRDWPVERVASELGMNRASVYLIGHRLRKRLATELEHLRAQLG